MRSSVVMIAVSLALGACGSPKESSETKPSTGARPAPPPAPEAPATRQPSAAATAVALPTDATVMTIKGMLEANTDAEYVIGEEKGSVFMAHAVTPEQDLDISVYRADTGARIADEQPSNPSFFMARLPETLGYLVAVRGTGSATPYDLIIEVPRRIYFDPKTSSAEISGTAPANAVLEYLVPAGATIAAELTKAPGDAYLTAHGLAGQALLKAEAGSRTFTGVAPRADEELVLIFNQGATAGEFTLRIQRK